jgi:CTP synthase
VNVEMIDSEQITTENVADKVGHLDGVLIGPGFGNRGIEGKISSVKYIRENNIPFFGICLGLQVATIEYARNVCGLTRANSAEFEINDQNVIDLMESQKNVKEKGGTMRLGAYPAILTEDSLVYQAYQSTEISERHRHRFEVNNAFREILVQNGLKLSATSPDGNLVEIIELPNHPWYVGVQFHPELKSRVISGHPLFIGFIKAALKEKKRKEK